MLGFLHKEKQQGHGFENETKLNIFRPEKEKHATPSHDALLLGE